VWAEAQNGRVRGARSCQTVPTAPTRSDQVIRLSVLYPSSEGSTFDHDYYREKHVPLALRAWGLDKADIEKGIDGPYVAAVHFEFDSVEAMGAAMAAEATGDVMADVANYTNITPVLQTSEIVPPG
jgi:uncharacterized protein (TIGR02118 family)